MEEMDTKVLSLRRAYPFGEANGLAAEMAEIRNMVIEWDRSYNSSLRRGYIVEAFGRAGILQQFVRECWPNGATHWGQQKIAFYRKIKSQYIHFLAGEAPGYSSDGVEEEGRLVEDTVEEREFAQEADLRDFLAKNLEVIEKGLRIYDKEGNIGVEFSIDEGAGRIDLLAIDSSGTLVVIELKVSRGRNKTVGQLLYYMGWVDKHLGQKPCRGIIIAKDITEDLRLATSRAIGVLLCKYTLNVLVEKVS